MRITDSMNYESDRNEDFFLKGKINDHEHISLL